MNTSNRSDDRDRPHAGSAPTSSDGRGRANERSLSVGDVLLETRTAYLSLKGTSHSLVRTRHRSRSAPRAAPAAAGRRPLTVTEQCYYSATLSWIKLSSAPAPAAAPNLDPGSTKTRSQRAAAGPHASRALPHRTRRPPSGLPPPTRPATTPIYRTRCSKRLYAGSAARSA